MIWPWLRQIQARGPTFAEHVCRLLTESLRLESADSIGSDLKLHRVRPAVLSDT
jgi:hypothetical protein